MSNFRFLASETYFRINFVQMNSSSIDFLPPAEWDNSAQSHIFWKSVVLFSAVQDKRQRLCGDKRMRECIQFLGFIFF